MTREISAGKWIDYDPKSVPRWFKTIKEAPDQLIKPSEYVCFSPSIERGADCKGSSFVVQIKASEVIIGAGYGAGMTLRFPRESVLLLSSPILDGGVDCRSQRSQDRCCLGQIHDF